jgi:hypothetical protein
MKKPLGEIEAGDKVFVKSAGTINHTVTVDRVTKMQIIVGNDRYNRESGRLCGEKSGWHRPYIEFATEAELAEQQAKVEHVNTVYNITKLCDINALRKMPQAKLTRLLALLKEEL